MTELERHPQAARQGAAAIAVVAFTAVGMPAMAMRADAQREDAEWSARALAFDAYLNGADRAQTASAARLALDVEPAGYGWRARAGSTMVAEEVFGRQAITVSARLRDNSALAAVKPFQPASLRVAAKNTREQHCLAQAIYYEARGESRQGQMAVAEVVSNRTRSGVYPGTVCGVVYQGSERVTGCQFSFTCDGSLNKRPRGAAWREANAISAQVLMGMVRPVTHRATHYHTVAIDPYWSASLVETTRIGAHVFYRSPSRRERAALTAPQDVMETGDGDIAPVEVAPSEAPVVAPVTATAIELGA